VASGGELGVAHLAWSGYSLGKVTQGSKTHVCGLAGEDKFGGGRGKKKMKNVLDEKITWEEPRLCLLNRGGLI